MIIPNFFKDLYNKLENKARKNRLIRKTLRSMFPARQAPVFTFSEYAHKYNAKWHKVYERMPNNIPPPIYSGKLTVNFKHVVDQLPEAGVLELDSPFILGNHDIITKEGCTLLNGHFFPDDVLNSRYNPAWLVNQLKVESKPVKGVCLSLGSAGASGHYGHFLTDSMGRLELFHQAGYNFSDVDHIYLPKPFTDLQNIYDQLEIPLEKCIWSNSKQRLNPEVLLAPSFPGTARNYPKWLPLFLQSKLLKSFPTPSRRLYITRAGYKRNVSNSEPVNNILLRHGFEICDPATAPNSPQDFAESAIVVGPHGSGMMDIVFCQPGTKVLELVPTDHPYPYYYTLSHAANLEYRCLVCRSENERSEDARGPSPFNFYVDEGELERTLTLLTQNL